MTTKEKKDSILATAIDLIRFETVEDSVDQQSACLAYLAQSFSPVFEVREYTFHGHPALVLTNAPDKHSDIIIAGHVDVVGAPEALFEAEVRDGKLFGRGAYDMKGPLAAALHAAKDAIEGGVAKTITLLVTTDEEVSGNGTRAFLSEAGYTANSAILPDGGDQMHMVVAQKGFAQLALTVSGNSAHASNPWDGTNPIPEAAALVSKIVRAYPIPQGADDWKTTVTPTKVESGDALNQIPSSATVYVDVRYTQESDLESFRAWFKNEYPANGSLETVEANGMFSVDENSSLIESLSQTIHSVTGAHPKYLRECGTSDAVFFTEHGIPAVLYRPNGGGAHADGEWVDIESLSVLYRVLLGYLEKEQ